MRGDDPCKFPTKQFWCRNPCWFSMFRNLYWITYEMYKGPHTLESASPALTTLTSTNEYGEL